MPTPPGRVAQIHRKPRTPGERGLPKWPVAEAVVGVAGLVGDFNRYRHERKNDDPDSALLLHTREMLARIRDDGWPVAPGHLGENLTLEGVPYEAFRIGTRWRIGPQVVVQVSRACDPCKNLRVLPYVGARFREFSDALRDRRGWYARVLRPGHVSVGDRVESDGSTDVSSHMFPESE